MLDGLARRLDAYRWVACWEEEDAWAARAARSLERDQIYVRVAARLTSISGSRLTATTDLGHLGDRLAVAGVRHILTIGGGQDGLRCVLVFENPDPDRLRRLADADGVLELAELAPMTGQLLRSERWAGELFTFLDWTPHLADMALAARGEAEALEWLARLAGQRAVLALAALPGGISVTAARAGDGGWRHQLETSTELGWDEAWARPEAAVDEMSRIAGVGDLATWAIGRAGALEPQVILALGGGSLLPSRKGMDLFATGLARSLADRRAGAADRESGLLQERSRLASMTHEGITQVLTNVAIQLEVLDQVLEDPLAAREMIRSSRTAVLEALDSLRGAVFEMAPGVPTWGDLATGLRRYTADFGAQWGLHVSCSVEGKPRQVSGEILALAFAFVHEGLTNIRRHAGTTRGEVTLRFEPGRLFLSVRDQGVGFHRLDGHERAFRRRRGLALTEARVGLMGGRFEVRSVPGRGTRISLRVAG